jgi:hypothetical protein
VERPTTRLPGWIGLWALATTLVTSSADLAFASRAAGPICPDGGESGSVSGSRNAGLPDDGDEGGKTGAATGDGALAGAGARMGGLAGAGGGGNGAGAGACVGAPTALGRRMGVYVTVGTSGATGVSANTSLNAKACTTNIGNPRLRRRARRKNIFQMIAPLRLRCARRKTHPATRSERSHTPVSHARFGIQPTCLRMAQLCTPADGK